MWHGKPDPQRSLNFPASYITDLLHWRKLQRSKTFEEKLCELWK